VVIVVAATMTAGCCPSQAKFPVIVRTASPLHRGELMKAFEGRPPTMTRVALPGVLVADEQIAERLQEAELVDAVRRLPGEQPVELLLWEAECFLRPGDLVVGVFDASTGRALTVDGRELFYGRVSVAE
jgi:hypothetical protein